MNKKITSDIMLLVTSIIWGSAFVAQKAGTVLEPFTYNGLRNLIGALALIPVILIFSKVKRNQSKPGEYKDSSVESCQNQEESKKALLVGGLLCGIIMAIASTLQQYGLYLDTDAGKAGFITTLYIVIVPVLGIFIGKKIRPLIWFCVVLGAAGFYLLTMAGKNEGFSLQIGDLLILVCAFMFSIHILLIDHYAPKCDGIKLSCIQFFTAGIICTICMFIFESPQIKVILDTWLPIMYCGVMSSGVAYTLQILGQKHAEPTAASLILSLESVFAVVSGALFLHERMSVYEIIGCFVIFTAVIIAQLPERSSDKLIARSNQE